MQIQRVVIIGSALVMLSACQHSLVRDSMPTVTRTGEVKDIVIKETLSPATVTANPGDEIRWINKRQGDVRVSFLTPVMERLTCQRNFDGIMAAEQNEYTAKIDTNDTAGVCFRDSAQLKYVVRAESNDPSGEQNFAGDLRIGSEAQVYRPMEKNTNVAANSDQDEPAMSR